MKLLILLLTLSSTAYSAPARKNVLSSLFNLEVRMGKVPGISMATTIGHSNDVGTSVETLMPGTGSIAPDALISTPATVTVSSSDANDTSAGSGARTVLLSGLDSNLDPISETITMNGQTGVTSANTYKWIQSFAVLTTGATGSNEGIIYVGTGTVTAGKPAVLLGSGEIGANISQTAAYMVPNGKIFHPRQVTIALGDSTKFLSVEIYIRNAATTLYVKALEVNAPAGYWTQTVEAFAGQGEGTVIESRAAVDSATATATVALAGYLVDE
jgi:hypothetical protein